MGRLRAIVAGVGGGVILAGGLTVAMNAQGAYCCDPWGVPGANAFIQAGTTVVQSITTAVTNVVNELVTGPLYTWEQGVGKTSTEMSKQTASARVIEQGAIQSDTQLYLEGRRADAMEAAVEPAMLDETVPNALMVAEGQPARARAERQLGAKLADAMVTGPFTPPTPWLDRHLSTYCDYRHAANGLCDQQAADDMQNADATVATIYGGTSATYSDAQRDAALAAVQTIVASDPLRAPLAAGQGAQDRMIEGYTLADQAALSIAGHALHVQIADRSRKHAVD